MQRHTRAFKTLHERVLAGVEDPGLKALLGFLAAWKTEQFQSPLFTADMLDANFVFRLDGQQSYLHQSEAAQYVWAHLQKDADAA